MYQKKGIGQNVQVNDPGTINTPDNPYTTLYNNYIAKPEDRNVKPTNSNLKWILATIFCALSNVLMAGYFGLWGAFTFEIIADHRTAATTIETYSMFSVGLYLYFILMALGFSIAAKVLHRKSIWAVINIILSVAILAFVFILSPVVVKKGQEHKLNQEETITEELNSDIEELMEEYSFDVMDIDEDFIYQMDTNYEIWIYVSSEASKEQISKLDEFLEGLYEMDSSREYQITFEVHPLVFEPDDNSRFVFKKPYTFRYETLSPHPAQADIDKHIHVLEYDRRDPSHVPESVEDGVMLIVVR